MSWDMIMSRYLYCKYCDTYFENKGDRKLNHESCKERDPNVKRKTGQENWYTLVREAMERVRRR